jgi:hypothetical protein
MQARPPEMMENEVEVKVATTPDSSLPSVGIIQHWQEAAG